MPAPRVAVIVAAQRHRQARQGNLKQRSYLKFPWCLRGGGTEGGGSRGGSGGGEFCGAGGAGSARGGWGGGASGGRGPVVSDVNPTVKPHTEGDVLEYSNDPFDGDYMNVRGPQSLTPDELNAVIDRFNEGRGVNSPITGMGEEIYRICEAAGIDAVFALAFFQKGIANGNRRIEPLREQLGQYVGRQGRQW